MIVCAALLHIFKSIFMQGYILEKKVVFFLYKNNKMGSFVGLQMLQIFIRKTTHSSLRRSQPPHFLSHPPLYPTCPPLFKFLFPLPCFPFHPMLRHSIQPSLNTTFPNNQSIKLIQQTNIPNTIISISSNQPQPSEF